MRTKKGIRALRKELHNYSVKELKDIIIKLTPLDKAPRKYILKRDLGKCRLCGSSENTQVHHITPKSIGGTNHEYNLITLCKLCHIFIHCNPMGKINKSDLIKSKIIKINGDTFSHNGKKWGRPKLGGVEDKILKLHKEGKNIRQICENVYYYKSGHKKYVSVGFVHKLLNEKYIFNEDKNIKNIAGDKEFN